MELRLIVYAAGALLGMVIIYAGVRLLAGSGPGESRGNGTEAHAGGAPSFLASGAVFIAVGVLMIVLAAKMFMELRHEELTAVSPLSYLNLDMPPPPPDDARPQPNGPDAR
jgi:hypothetical protein